MKRTMAISFLAALIVCGGCRSLTFPARHEQLQQDAAYWMDYDATRRGAVVTIDASGNNSPLSEPELLMAE